LSDCLSNQGHPPQQPVTRPSERPSKSVCSA